MTMFANKNNLMSATLLSAVATLASCGRSEPPPAASTAATFVQLAEVEDGVDVTLPTVVERRHFAIYNSYRVLFDDSPDVFHSRAKGQEDGLQQAVMAFDGDVSACSMRAMLLKE
jgi:predicted small lipoprotein YifL